MPAPALTLEHIQEAKKLKKNYDDETHNDYQSGIFPLWLIDNADQLLIIAEKYLKTTIEPRRSK